MKKSYCVGIDKDISSLYVAKNKYDDLILADVRYLPFRKKTFDFSACIDVMDLPELRESRKKIMEGIEMVTKSGIFYHFFNGKIGPLKDLVEKYGKVKYIGKKKEIDSYRSKYRRFKLPVEQVMELLDNSSKEEREFLKLFRNKNKVSLGSYIVYISLGNR